MNNKITVKEAKTIYNQILGHYDSLGLGRYNPDGNEWFADSMNTIESMSHMHGFKFNIFLDEIYPNVIATQPDISKKKMDALYGILEKADWEMFPVISTYVPGIANVRKYCYVGNDGHTREKIYLESGKGKIPSFIFESDNAAAMAECVAQSNMMRLNMRRYPRIKDLRMNGDWDHNGIISKPSKS